MADVKYTTSQIDKFLDIIRKNRFDESIPGQATVISYLARLWNGYITGEQKERVFQEIAPRITRLRPMPPDLQRSVFEEIIRLPSEVDVGRAVNQLGSRPAYHLGTDETLYEQAPGFLNRYLQYVKHNQVPLAFHYWSALTMIGAVARRNIYISVGHQTLYLNQYTFLIGVSGCGKSVAADYAVDIIRRMNRQLVETAEYRGPEGVTRLTGDAAIEYAKCWQVNLMPQDSTQEGIIKELAAINKLRVPNARGELTPQSVDATGLMHLDEVAVQFGEDAYNLGKKAPFYTTIYSRDTYDKTTSGEGRIAVNDLAYSILGCSAPEWLTNAVTPHILKGGFVDRSVYVYRWGSERVYPTGEVPDPDPVEAERLAKWLIQWTRPSDRGYDVKQRAVLRDEANQYLSELYLKERHEQIRMRDYYGRGPVSKRASVVRSYETILKQATILAMSEETFPFIERRHVAHAHEVCAMEDESWQKFTGLLTEHRDESIYKHIEVVFRNHGWRVSKGLLTKLLRAKVGDVKKQARFLDQLHEEGTIGKEKLTGKSWEWVWLKPSGAEGATVIPIRRGKVGDDDEGEPQ